MIKGYISKKELVQFQEISQKIREIQGNPGEVGEFQGISGKVSGNFKEFQGDTGNGPGNNMDSSVN